MKSIVKKIIFKDILSVVDVLLRVVLNGGIIENKVFVLFLEFY